MLGNAIIVTILSCILAVEWMNGHFGLSRPLVAGALTGLVLGDVQQGVVVGAAIQLIFMGASGVGAAVPPDSLIGTVIATALAILSGEGLAVALSLAVPVAIAAQALDILARTLTSGLMHLADRSAENGQYRKLELVHYSGILITFARTAIIVFPTIYFGVEAVETMMAVIPSQVLRGLEVSGGILPAVGFGMLLTMLDIKYLKPFFYIGFALATFGGFSTVGVTMVGVCVALMYDHFRSNKNNDDNMTTEVDELDRALGG